MNELNNFEIDGIVEYAGKGKKYKNYGGCIASDDVHKLCPSRPYFYIVNLGKRCSGGTHWTLLFNCSNDCVIYFDSFGVNPPNHVNKFMIATKKKRLINNQTFQSYSSSRCGWFCIYFAMKLGLNNHEIKFYKICNYLKSITNAERIIDGYERDLYNRVFHQNLKNGAFVYKNFF